MNLLTKEQISQKTDNELVKLYQVDIKRDARGDFLSSSDRLNAMNSDRALKELLDRYNPLIVNITMKYRTFFNFNSQFTKEDLELQVVTGFIEGIKVFDPEKGASIGAYVSTSMIHEAVNYIRRNSYQLSPSKSPKYNKAINMIGQLTREGHDDETVLTKLCELPNLSRYEAHRVFRSVRQMSENNPAPRQAEGDDANDHDVISQIPNEVDNAFKGDLKTGQDTTLHQQRTDILERCLQNALIDDDSRLVCAYLKYRGYTDDDEKLTLEDVAQDLFNLGKTGHDSQSAMTPQNLFQTFKRFDDKVRNYIKDAYGIERFSDFMTESLERVGE